jgi:hypothetical protein
MIQALKHLTVSDGDVFPDPQNICLNEEDVQ